MSPGIGSGPDALADAVLNQVVATSGPWVVERADGSVSLGEGDGLAEGDADGLGDGEGDGLTDGEGLGDGEPLGVPGFDGVAELPGPGLGDGDGLMDLNGGCAVAVDDSDPVFAFGDFEFGNAAFAHEVDQCLEFAQIHCKVIQILGMGANLPQIGRKSPRFESNFTEI